MAAPLQKRRGPLFSQLDNFDLRSLSPEALMEILSRLPLRDIFSTRCVSQQWYDDAPVLFMDRSFANAFSDKSPMCLIISDDQFRLNVVEFKKNHREFKFPMELATFRLNDRYHLPPINNQNLIGSIGGFLLFLGEGNHIFMSNPFLGEFVDIPAPELPKNVLSYGAAYSDGHYTILQFARKVEMTNPPTCEVYGFKLGANVGWVNLLDAPAPCERDFVNFNFENKLYWIIDVAVNRRLELCCLNIQSGMLEAVPRLPLFRQQRPYANSLLVLYGKLCLLHEYLDDVPMFVIYALDNGVWIQQFSANRSSVVAGAGHPFFRPISMLNDGEIICAQMDSRRLHPVNYLAGYNPSTKKSRSIRFSCPGYIVAVLTPTFQSLRSIVGESMQVTVVWDAMQPPVVGEAVQPIDVGEANEDAVP